MLSLIWSTFRLCLRYWWQFLLAAASAVGALAVFDVIWNLSSPDSREMQLLGFLAVVFLSFWGIILLEILAGQTADRPDLSFRHAYRASFPAALVAFPLLTAVLITAGTMVAIPVAGLLASPYFFARFVHAFDSVVLDRVGPIEAMKRAWAVTRGRIWVALSRELLWDAAVAGLGIAQLLALPYFPAGAAIGIAGLPLLGSFRMLVYRDLVRRQRLALHHAAAGHLSG